MNKEYDDLLDQIMKHIRVSPDDIDEHLMTEVSTTVFYGILVLMARKIMTDEEKKEFISAVTRTIKHKLINEFMQQSKGDKLVVDQEDFVLSLNKILDEMEKRLRSLLNTH
jgi:division protein CdvB (Snf7/Vps24/ESCRT-III family)